jgi:signal transduction histidine kinase
MTEQISEEKDWGALAEKHLASIKRDMKISLEDATARAARKVMTEFNDTERESKVKQELVKQQLDRLEADIAQLRVKTQELRNDAIGEVLQLIKELRPAIKPLEGMGKGKTTEEWFDILTETIKEKK